MYPVIIGNGRSLTSDAIIGGYQVPKGVRKNIFFILSMPLNFKVHGEESFQINQSGFIIIFAHKLADLAKFQWKFYAEWR
jgi:hypothetical protein